MNKTVKTLLIFFLVIGLIKLIQIIEYIFPSFGF